MVDELRMTDGAAAIRLERDYDASPAEIWAAWTDPGRLARWLGTPSGPLTGASAPVRLVFGDGPDQWADVDVVTADPPRLLELKWTLLGGQTSLLRIEIAAVDDARTRVRIDHAGLGESTIGYGAGWQAYLDLLEEQLHGAVSSTWDERFEAALPSWQERAELT